MESTFKPGIGRIVHYSPPQGGCRAAIIVGVVNDVTVALQVFSEDEDGAYVLRRVVRNDEEKRPGTWHVAERV